MARQKFFFFWPSPKKVCPSLFYTMMHGQKRIKLEFLSCGSWKCFTKPL